jgi:hypothetical protein
MKQSNVKLLSCITPQTTIFLTKIVTIRPHDIPCMTNKLITQTNNAKRPYNISKLMNAEIS